MNETANDIEDYPRDRDYFFGESGDIFQVLGYIHYDNKIHCLCKYEVIEGADSSPGFSWHSNLTDRDYRRVIPHYSAETATSNIKAHLHSELSSFYGAEFILYPKGEIRRYLSPQAKLSALMEQFNANGIGALKKYPKLSREALECVFIIEELLKIPPEQVGITGSILWDAAHDYSDIDLVVYGIDNVQRWLDGIDEMINVNRRFRRLNMSEIMQISSSFSKKTGIPVDDCIVFTSAKKYLQYFGDTYLSIAFSPCKDELVANPLATRDTEARNLKGFDRIKITAKVGDMSWGYFYPAIVPLKDVEILDCSSDRDSSMLNIQRLLVWERECSGYYSEGDTVEVQGLVQRVENVPRGYVSWDKRSVVFQTEEIDQIVIGTAENYGHEFIKNVNL